jgi:hypothetical protein
MKKVYPVGRLPIGELNYPHVRVKINKGLEDFSGQLRANSENSFIS